LWKLNNLGNCPLTIYNQYYADINTEYAPPAQITVPAGTSAEVKLPAYADPSTNWTLLFVADSLVGITSNNTVFDIQNPVDRTGGYFFHLHYQEYTK
jgi:hypothetical protein